MKSMQKMLSMAMMALLAATLMSCAQGAKDTATPQGDLAKEEKPTLDVRRATVSTTQATIETIDLKHRMVRLRSLDGKPFTVRVDKNAANLHQVKVGNQVEITYAEVLEVRMAEPGEVRNEIETIVGGAKPGAQPRGFGIVETDITATILEIDKANEAAKLEFADGTVAIVKVQNPANLDKVAIGDRIAIKHIEALEIVVKDKKPVRKKKSATAKKQPVSDKKQPAIDEKQPVSDNKQPAIDEKQPASDNKQPVSDNKQPVSDNKQPAIDEKQPVSDNKQPAIDEKQPAIDEKQPVSDEKH